MVFQNYALYQHMSVYDNLAFGLRTQKTSEAEIKTAINRAAGMLACTSCWRASRSNCRAASSSASRSAACIVRNPQIFVRAIDATSTLARADAHRDRASCTAEIPTCSRI